MDVPGRYWLHLEKFNGHGVLTKPTSFPWQIIKTFFHQIENQQQQEHKLQPLFYVKQQR